MFPRLVRISEDLHQADVTVEWKGYITVLIDKNPRAVNLYWQIVDPVFSLLELGFEHPSGRLVKCAVPLFNGDVEDQHTEPLSNAAQGTPFFDLSPWPLQVSDRDVRGNYLEQLGRIRLLKKQNGIMIVCKDSPPVRSLAYGEKLVCDFGEGDELVSLSLVGDFPL